MIKVQIVFIAKDGSVRDIDFDYNSELGLAYDIFDKLKEKAFVCSLHINNKRVKCTSRIIRERIPR